MMIARCDACPWTKTIDEVLDVQSLFLASYSHSVLIDGLTRTQRPAFHGIHISNEGR
jgi:hypothetical protein